jgi:uncharacterized cysteine cluster protein YcgN (CxxCxxCC family)
LTADNPTESPEAAIAAILPSPDDRTREGELNNADPPFWKRKSLEEMTSSEWESLCDRCGRCCLLKLEDEDTGEIYRTRLACRLLDLGTCQCSNYPDRQKHVSDCVSITPEAARNLPWLPETCAYRLVAEGSDLAWWHYLVSGDPNTVHEAGISVRGWVISEERARANAMERYIIQDWGRPRRHKRARAGAR